MNLSVAIVGFGNVGRALAELLIRKKNELRDQYDLIVRVVGISTGSHGLAIDPEGIALRTALDAVRYGSLEGLHRASPVATTADFVGRVKADLLFECAPTNPHDGEPSLSNVRTALQRGMHVVTANKGPVAFGYHELSALARQKGLGFFFESTVMDGAPALGAGRESLPASQIRRIRGIFNSTTNYILTRMEEDGMDFDAALGKAQEIGVAETDPTLDVDGWDSSIKTVIMANALMGADLRPVDVDRTGIRGMALEEVRKATEAGQRIKLICEALRADDGTVRARVSPELIPMNDPMANIRGTTSVVEYEADTLRRLTLIEHDGGPDTTAYGMFADMLNILRGRHREGDLTPGAV
jgi:homoserine dehydrogenase